MPPQQLNLTSSLDFMIFIFWLVFPHAMVGQASECLRPISSGKVVWSILQSSSSNIFIAVNSIFFLLELQFSLLVTFLHFEPFLCIKFPKAVSPTSNSPPILGSEERWGYLQTSLWICLSFVWSIFHFTPLPDVISPESSSRAVAAAQSERVESGTLIILLMCETFFFDSKYNIGSLTFLSMLKENSIEVWDFFHKSLCSS